ncbi:ABC transporter permease [Paenibacillus turpanensis]|uniref:ABC transporter permease n=1 Tax=Paenibacillus turpanensis TaxID=2689078 RepID=UPI002441E36D|nr:ABC transporter permease [Paenibacillus turpanensis]
MASPYENPGNKKPRAGDSGPSIESEAASSLAGSDASEHSHDSGTSFASGVTGDLKASETSDTAGLPDEIIIKGASATSGPSSKTGMFGSSGAVLPPHPFLVLVQKEMSDHIRSWRFIILLGLIWLTCIGSLYAALSTIRSIDPASEELQSFLFLRLFTLQGDTLPSFITFVGFLGPLLGIGMGFDVVSSERSKGTLSRLLSQPIYRDQVLHAKFVAALLVISVMFVALGFMVMGMGLLAIGIPPTAEELGRMILFLLLSIVYIGFWLNLSIWFSARFKQAATAALAGIAVWIFYSVFFSMLVQLVANATAPAAGGDAAAAAVNHAGWMQQLMRLSPNQLYQEATTTLLVPEIRTLGPLTMDQVIGAIPNSALPLGQSLLIVWPQVTGLIAATLVCFALAYVHFMRQEIRSRS